MFNTNFCAFQYSPHFEQFAQLERFTNMDPEHVSTFHRGLKANKWKQVSIEEGLMCLNQHFNPINNEEANQLFAQLTTLYKMGIGTEVGRFFCGLTHPMK